jgi:hypothetical protein
MGRDYSHRYIREQARRYAKSPLYRNKEFLSGMDMLNAWTAQNGPPDGYRQAILEWLDGSLSEVVKRNIRFQKSSDSNSVRLQTNEEYLGRNEIGYLTFHPDKVNVHCGGTGLDVTVEYAHPQMFEILQRALTKFYNGIK